MRSSRDIAGMPADPQPPPSPLPRTALADQAPRRAHGQRGLEFGRNELSGAFGDIGTDLPLLVGMVVAAGLDATSVLVVFGLMQVATALAYRMPMPVQPLKAVAAIVITQGVAPATIHGGGLAIGVLMLVLAATGALDWLARVVPLAVVRGLQFGLGLQLSLLALRDMIPSGGAAGYVLAAVAFGIVVLLLGNRRFPPALFVIALGVAWAIASSSVDMADVAAGFVLLALPQIPLSLGNSVLATRQLAADLFPGRPAPTVRRIGLTYAAMNLVSPFLGGVPTCHGSGGMAGHYAMGGRTGGSVVLYGVFWLVLGCFFGGAFATLAGVFPRPVLGVLLVVEGLTLLALARDLAPRHAELGLALLVGLLAATLPWGYLVALVVGVALAPLARSGRLQLGR